MNETILRPGYVAAAAVVIGGGLLVVLPQHASSIVKLVLVTIAAAAGLYALARSTPSAWWASPFDRTARDEKGRAGSDEIALIRRALSARRQRVPGGPALPPETLRLIQPLIRVRLERIGLDPSDHRFMELARARLSPLAWTVLVGEPLKWPPWYRTLRSDTRRTVAIVHRILDQMDDLTPARWHRAGPVTQYWTGDEQIDDTSRVAAARPSR